MITRGVRNNNPGNIDRGEPWVGLAKVADMTKEQKAEKRFCVFTDAKYGIRAIAKLLQTYEHKYKADTVRKIINRWAPPVENETTAYVETVAKACHVDPDTRLDVDHRLTAYNLVNAIISHECAGYRYPDEVVNEALDLAGVQPN